MVKDLTGERFGNLVAVRPTEERKAHNVVWECLCDCGNTKLVRTSMLLNGNTRSCGCLKREAADLTGQRFDKLVVLRPTGERKWNSVVWECICDCGKTTLVRRDSLTSGLTRSCGCLKLKGNGRKIHQDLTGRKFGMLTAIRPTEERCNGSIMWECRCDCGKTKLIRTNSLTSGLSRSCGCQRGVKR